jgi:aspartyl-tRNA(Asn)/glutamyl-tRNA(Gln) amidotransferase subunit A
MPAETLRRVADDLAAGRTTSRALVEACLERAQDGSGEGARAFLALDADGARAAARAMDAMRAAGVEPSPFAGIPVSVKDAFDVRRQVTRAGSTVLDPTPAANDAPAVAAWRRAGLVLLGRTNMTEFAYSGLGLNPHFGTPANPWDRGRGRVPGGSSSGAAVSVADGMACGALGSDTGGSCRIPAAFCGLVGFKPTQARISRAGMVPLSPTLDTVGVIGRSVACCAELEALLGHRMPAESIELPRAPRLLVPRNYFLDDADRVVSASFERTLSALSSAGADLVEVDLPELAEIAEASAGGGFPAAESYAWHRDLLARHGDSYDPRVAARIRRGEHQSAADLLALHTWRASFIARLRERLEGFDAMACPTVPIVAPPLDALIDDDEEYGRINLLVLRNPTVVNLFDGCAMSIPMHQPGDPPSGLMLAAPAGADENLLRVARWAEARL